MYAGDGDVYSNKDCMAILSHLSRLKENAETRAKVMLKFLEIQYRWVHEMSLYFELLN